MELSVEEDGCIVLKKVYNHIALETHEGNRIYICMRDDTFELAVKPAEKQHVIHSRVDMKTGSIYKMCCS